MGLADIDHACVGRHVQHLCEAHQGAGGHVNDIAHLGPRLERIRIRGSPMNCFFATGPHAVMAKTSKAKVRCR